MRHSAAHVMAEAIQSIFPDTKFGIGPAIENGFYYDIDFMDYSISEDGGDNCPGRAIRQRRSVQG